MQENLIFISVFNYGAIEIADNHLASLKRQGIDNYMAYVTDQESLDYLQAKGYHVSFIHPSDYTTSTTNNAGLTKEKEDFGTNGFNDFSYVRYVVISKLLREGKTVWYMDIDTVVLSDVRRYVNDSNGCDMIMQNDINMACTGCMLCYPTPATLKIMEDTFLRRNANYNDQLWLNNIMKPMIEKNQCKIAYFQNHLFPNGLLYFHALHANPHFLDLQKRFRKYRDEEKGPVAFVHANWMVGIDKKITALKEHGLWFL